MSRKRRDFGVDLPEAPPAAEGQDRAASPAARAPRRSPMAAAVRETAAASAERAERAEAIRAENDALAAELVALRAAGLVTDLVALDAVGTTRLARDRAPGPDPELGELIASIRAVGLSNPIRVSPAGEGYELVQGWRRLSAFRALFAETGDPAWARIPAAMVPEGARLEDLYRRMVDENMVRRDISFAEMAGLARRYAADPESDAGDVDTAVTRLFQSAGYQKRSYIRAFAELLDWLDKDLEHPSAIPRSLGLALRRRIDAEPGLAGAVSRALRELGERTAEEELEVLRRFSGEGGATASGAPSAARPKPRPARGAEARYRIATRAGEAVLAAGKGRVEIRLERDFSGLERARLEAALAAFLRALEG